VRGVKGSKVLRTRKIKLHNYNRDNQWGYFCSNNCYNEFATKYIQQILAIAPRTECQETPIEDPKKVRAYEGAQWHTWEIKEVDNNPNP
jgi:YHS domain-containing protein